MVTANQLKNAVKFPTSIIVRGQDLLGIELAKSLLEQGGFVIIVDRGSREVEKYLPLIDSYQNLILMDYSGISTLQSDLRRLDYVFYLDHQYADYSQKISTQEFLQASNYLDTVLDLTAKFDAKFLLTTSIKAHQTIVGNKVIDLNYELQTAEKYSVYSELEIQRYSESLVKEYQEKVGINTRIVRLGTLLGRGMEINLDSFIVKLIIQALQGERLIIPGDGLDTDFYIHYLDAAYGIIKAQFSPNTKGQIFTLSNEEEISVLGIAYKMIELIPSAKEIQFDQNDNTLPPIKLYKPATNLTSIGWSPRISFDRALSQTIDFIKARLSEVNGNVSSLEKELIPISGSKNRKEQKKGFLDFFFIASKEDDPTIPEVNTSNLNSEGALARLIAERKNQERARKGSIILANNNLREALQKKPDRTPLERFDNWLNDLFIRIKQKVNIFKNLTLREFGLWMVGIITFLIVYFIFLSPVLNLSKEVFFLRQNITTISKSRDTYNFNEINVKTNEILDNINNIEARLKDLEYVFIIFNKNDDYANARIFISQLEQYFSGLDNFSKSLIPLDSFKTKFSPGFVQRLDDQLVISSTKADYLEDLNSLNSNKSLLSLGNKAMEENSKKILVALESMPGWVVSLIGDEVKDVVDTQNEGSKIVESVNNLNLITGKDKIKNYLLLIQDNQRFYASGGKLVGYYLFGVQNAKIITVKFVNFSEFQNTNPNLSQAAFKDITLVSKKILTQGNIVFDDINYISDMDLFYDEVEELVEAKEATNVDMGIIVNLNAFAMITGENNDLNFKQKVFNSDNFFDVFNNLLSSDATDQQRSNLVISYSSNLLENKVNNVFKDKSVGKSIESAVNSKDIKLFSNDPIFQRFIMSLVPESSVKDQIYIGMNSDGSTNKFNSLSEIEFSGNITVKKDLSTVKSFKVKFNADGIANTYFCMPSSIAELEINETATENYSQAFDVLSLQKICAIVLPDDDLKYGLNYKTGVFEKTTDSSYNYLFKINSISGTLINYDLEFLFEDTLDHVVPITENSINQTNGYLFKGQFVNSKTFNFKINR